jgi:hypothetical protein
MRPTRLNRVRSIVAFEVSKEKLSPAGNLVRSGSRRNEPAAASGLGRVKTKIDLVVMPSGRRIFAFFCSERGHKPQNFGCVYTAQRFHTARVKTRLPAQRLDATRFFGARPSPPPRLPPALDVIPPGSARPRVCIRRRARPRLFNRTPVRTRCGARPCVAAEPARHLRDHASRCDWPAGKAATYAHTGTAVAFIISELPGERAEALLWSFRCRPRINLVATVLWTG